MGNVDKGSLENSLYKAVELRSILGFHVTIVSRGVSSTNYDVT